MVILVLITTPGTRLVVKQNNGTAYNNQAQTSSANAAVFQNTNGHTSGGTYTGYQFNITGDSQNRICSMGMISESSSNRNSSLVFHTDDNGNRIEKLRITSGGRVGIATASPQGAMELHVGSGSGIANTLVITRKTTSNYAAITWKTESGGTADWSIGQNDAGDFEVFHAGADASTAFTIKDSGSGAYHVLPGGNDAQDLGSTSLRCLTYSLLTFNYE